MHYKLTIIPLVDRLVMDYLYTLASIIISNIPTIMLFIHDEYLANLMAGFAFVREIQFVRVHPYERLMPEQTSIVELNLLSLDPK